MPDDAVPSIPTLATEIPAPPPASLPAEEERPTPQKTAQEALPVTAGESALPTAAAATEEGLRQVEAAPATDPMVVASDPAPAPGEPAAPAEAAAAAAPEQTAAPAQESQPAFPEVHDDGASGAGVSTNSSTGLQIDTEDDLDSAIGEDNVTSSRVSVSSSVFHFVEEFGRTYHKYKAGKYYLPNDEAEQSRLDLQHSIALKLLNNKLYLAPIEESSTHRVLDIGTGTGIWAIEFALEHPNADVLGTDLSPIQPAFVPPNCRFEVDDFDDDWAYGTPFDYVHGRYLCLFIRDLQRLMQQCFDNLRPGGWCEFMETVLDIRSVDGTIEGTAIQRWNGLVLQGIRRTGREPLCAYSYADYMQRVGFVNVAVKKFYMPVHTWAKGRDQKIMGALQLTNALEALSPLSLGIFVKVLGWKQEDLEEFLVDVRREMTDKSIHAYTPILVIYGQKPMPA